MRSLPWFHTSALCEPARRSSGRLISDPPILSDCPATCTDQRGLPFPDSSACCDQKPALRPCSGPQAPTEIIMHLNGAEIFDAPSERGTLHQVAGGVLVPGGISLSLTCP